MSDAIRELIAAKLTELESELAYTSEGEASAKARFEEIELELKLRSAALNDTRARIAALKSEIEAAKNGLAAFDPARVRRVRKAGEKRVVTDETRAKMSAAHKARHAAKRAAETVAVANGAVAAE